MFKMLTSLKFIYKSSSDKIRNRLKNMSRWIFNDVVIHAIWLFFLIFFVFIIFFIICLEKIQTWIFWVQLSTGVSSPDNRIWTGNHLNTNNLFLAWVNPKYKNINVWLMHPVGNKWKMWLMSSKRRSFNDKSQTLALFVIVRFNELERLAWRLSLKSMIENVNSSLGDNYITQPHANVVFHYTAI